MPSPIAVRRIVAPFRSKQVAEYAVNGFFGRITTARTTDLRLPDADGVLQQYGNGEVGIVDGDAVWCQPAATNSCAASRDLNGTGWSSSGTPVATQDQVGIDGVANTAWTLEDDNGAGFESKRNQISITSSSNIHSVRTYIKKTTGTPTHYPILQARVEGGSSRVVGVVINTTTGDLVNQATGGAIVPPTAKSSTLVGDFWKVTISLTDNASGNTFFRGDIFPAGNTDGSGTSSATTGSVVVDQFDMFLNTAHAIAHAVSPIPTSGAAASVNATQPVVPWPSGLVNDFVVKLTVEDSHLASTGGRIVDWYLDNNNTRSVYWVTSTGTTYRIQNFFSGSVTSSNSGTETAVSAKQNVSHEVTIWYSSTQGKKLYSAGVQAVSWNDTVAIPAVTSMALGFTQRFNEAQVVGKRSNVRIFKVQPGISAAEVLAL